MCDAGTFITLSEAARLLETTEMRVLMMLKKREIAGKQENDAWIVDKVSLQLCGKPKASDVVRRGCGCGCGSGAENGCGGY